METITNYFNNYTIVDLSASLFVLITMLVVCVRGIERFFKYIGGKLDAWYKRKRGVEKKNDTIATHTEEIKALTERIDRFTETVEQHYNLIIAKVEEQQNRLEQIEEESKKRDRALLRDRISAGMRYFSQNKDENGEVHISRGDHENMEALYEEYFGADGNGTYKQMHDNDFQNFIIDN